MKGDVKISIPICPRCGQAHEELKFSSMEGGVSVANYWAKCPVTKSPVLAMLKLDLLDEWKGEPVSTGSPPVAE